MSRAKLLLQWQKEGAKARGGTNSPPFHFPPWTVVQVEGQVDQHRYGGRLTAGGAPANVPSSFMEPGVGRWCTGKVEKY